MFHVTSLEPLPEPICRIYVIPSVKILLLCQWNLWYSFEVKSGDKTIKTVSQLEDIANIFHL